MVIQLSCSPEGTSTVLLREGIPHSLCTTVVLPGAQGQNSSHRESPQTHHICKLLKCQLKLWFTEKKKGKEGREGGNLEKIFTIHCKTNKPNFPRDPKRMPLISSIKGGREKEFPFFDLARHVLSPHPTQHKATEWRQFHCSPTPDLL